MKYKAGFFFLIALTLLFIITDRAYSQEGGWQVFSSRFCTVFYEDGVDLDIVNKRINLRFSDFYSPRRYRGSADLTAEDVLSDKFDAIFTRVEDILDMYPSKIHVTINIYKTRKALDEVYEEIFNVPNTADSFYIYKTNTIYTIEGAIREGILAHEMAHCIIDHYFVILPPRKIQEMLAVYADIHLKD
jgi:hypothetical protein